MATGTTATIVILCTFVIDFLKWCITCATFEILHLPHAHALRTFIWYIAILIDATMAAYANAWTSIHMYIHASVNATMMAHMHIVASPHAYTHRSINVSMHSWMCAYVIMISRECTPAWTCTDYYICPSNNKTMHVCTTIEVHAWICLFYACMCASFQMHVSCICASMFA